MNRTRRPRVVIDSPFPNARYLTSLLHHLTTLGVAVGDRASDLQTAPAVLHVQWPDSYGLQRRPARLARRLIRLGRLVHAAKRSPTARILVTVHNLSAHRTSALASAVHSWIMRKCDAAIVLTPSGKHRFAEHLPSFPNDRTFIVPHMDWRDEYGPISPDEARRVLGISGEDAVPIIGWFGTIRPYKGLEGIARVLRESPRQSVRFLLMGEVKRPDATLLTALDTLRIDPRVTLIERRVTDVEIRALLAVSSAVWLPFRTIENSGSAVAALASNCPVVAPACGAFLDYEATYGPELVRTYDGELTYDALMNLAIRPRPSVRTLESSRSGPQVALQHLHVYETVLRMPPRPGRHARRSEVRSPIPADRREFLMCKEA